VEHGQLPYHDEQRHLCIVITEIYNIRKSKIEMTGE
jgi:hypothetical protein